MKCEQNEPFTTDEINEITSKMNELARGGIVPLRKHVTIDMVRVCRTKTEVKSNFLFFWSS
ncbi:hypothetical protein BsIDN1_38240 [Bacillus safensis]|uniref:Uncharacterized protein n=1 Tax=Bacillus safensis TaxID=561879 RepID=A0A5S9MF53_BACIA|nr:hypothetical protein BsIDN1_38240 [Bacillus safensis]